MIRWYILDDENKPVPSTITEYVEWEEQNEEKRIVKQEYIGDDIRVSTVFLGLDHAWNSKTPVLWETMIFGGEHDQYQDRYTSYEDALEGHQKAITLITKENGNIEQRNSESD
jgi:hypothetical protein